MRTVNREPKATRIIGKNGLGYKYFNQFEWKGLYDNRNFLGVDQKSFEYCTNVYIDGEGLLCSRPSIKKSSVPIAEPEGLLIKTETFPDTVVYTYDATNYSVTPVVYKYKLYFVSSQGSTVSQEVGVHKLVLADNKIFIFENNKLTYYDLQTNSILNGTDKIYIPDELESPNILTASVSKTKTYTNPETDEDFSDFIGKNVIVKIDNTDYNVQFNTNSQKGFLSKVAKLTSAEHTNVVVKENTILTYTYDSVNKRFDIKYKFVGENNFNSISSPYVENGRAYEYTKPCLSDDGFHIVCPLAIAGDSVNHTATTWKIYCKSIVATETGGTFKWPDWTLVTTIEYLYDTEITDSQYISYVDSVSNVQNIEIQMFNKNEICFICNAGDVSAFSIFSDAAPNDKYILSGIYAAHWISEYEGTINTIYFWPVYGAFPTFENGAITTGVNLKYVNAYFFLYEKEKFYIFAECDAAYYKIGTSNTSDDYYNRLFIWSYSIPKETGLKPQVNYRDVANRTFVYDISVLPDSTENFVLMNVGSSAHFENYSIHYIFDDEKSYIDIYGGLDSYIDLSQDIKYRVKYARILITTEETGVANKNPTSTNTIYNNYAYKATVSQKTAGSPDSKIIAIPTVDNFYKNYIADTYVIYNNTYIKTTPGGTSYNIRPVAIVNDLNHSYFTGEINGEYFLFTNYPQQVITISAIDEGATNIFVPDFVAKLDSYFFAKDKNVYISKIGAKAGVDEFKWYFPKSLTQDFPEHILNIHTISSSDVAVFFENSIYYITKSDSNYYINKSKIPLGIKKGSDIITSFDGKYTIFSTSRGLVAMAYQDFVASTEQALSYLSDNIFDIYDKWNVSSIKLFQYKFWLICYRIDSKIIYVYDMRNGSWWPMQIPGFIINANELNYKLKFVFENTLCELDKSNTDYKDFNKYTIDWQILSQKLHFDATNFYKHISSITFNAVTDNTEPFTFKLKVTNYRKLLTEMEPETLTYSVDVIRTFVKRFNFFKVSEFQYLLYNDNMNKKPQPFSITNLSVKYKVTGDAR